MVLFRAEIEQVLAARTFECARRLTYFALNISVEF